MQKTIVVLLLVITSLLFSVYSQAQPRDQYSFSILKGEVSVTSAFCLPENCTTRTAELSGNFDGFLPGGGSQLFFTTSSVVTTPNLGFQLPQDPNADSNGTIRHAKFHFDGSVLEVKGEIDSRAFDGPLTQYTFIAEIAEPNFNSFGFFSARPDFRKCMSPLCGGYFVKRVNKKLTRCADGTKQKECYVAELIFDGSLDNSNPAFENYTPFLFQGKLLPQVFDGFGNLGVFSATGVYQSAAGQIANERFVGLENNGIVCITSPCFSFDEYILNKKRIVEISSIDLDRTGASLEQIEQARRIIANGGVLLASGQNHIVDDLNGEGKEFVAQQFFLPVLTHVTTCEKGYRFSDGFCRTPYGCPFPKLELTTLSGVPIIDLLTGEVTGASSKSCVDTCNFPAFFNGPGQCSIALP